MIEHREPLDASASVQAAADIAHSFNNIMTAVIGYADMLMNRHAAYDQDRVELLEIQKAGRRGAMLAQQLRAFTCASVFEPADTDLNQTVGAVTQTMRGLIQDDIAIVCDAHVTRAVARIDSRQVEQALMNLVLNAQEAVSAGRIHLDVSVQPAAAALGGSFVRVRIAARATHLDAAATVLDEPTRSVGLNLSAAYWIIRRNGGTLAVERRSGAVTFSISFPALQDAAPAAVPAPVVLVVDDEDSVRQLAGRILRAEGYCVLEAASAASALEYCTERGDTIDLILADVSIGDASGVDLVRRVMREWPGVRAVVMTGSDRRAFSVIAPALNARFLSKPFTASAIADTVRSAMTSSGETR
jgi:two-component system, cell cycle sensor histidine kinase and response regulator CckA